LHPAPVLDLVQQDVQFIRAISRSQPTGALRFHALREKAKQRLSFISQVVAQILNEVMQGTLRPSGVGCYQHDPSRRPSAKQLRRLLEA
jgi:hypothetical protein